MKWTDYRDTWELLLLGAAAYLLLWLGILYVAGQVWMRVM